LKSDQAKKATVRYAGKEVVLNLAAEQVKTINRNTVTVCGRNPFVLFTG
jgi:hypothetical protein